MTDVIPYQSPLSSEELLRQMDVVSAAVVDENPFARGLFRKGNQLVMHKRAVLPDRCVKSNESAGGKRLQRKLYWHHPAVYLALLFNVLIYAILALALRKRATIHIGLSEPWFRKRRQAMVVGWSLTLLGIGMIVAGAAFADSHGVGRLAALAIPIGIFTFLGGAIYGLLCARMVSPARITDDYVWLKGVHPAFLADLPEWPFEP